MGRSGYTDDWDGDGTPPEFYRRAVDNAIAGKRGQAALRELARAMDAMPDKRLIDEQLCDDDGCMCTLGVLAAARGLDLTKMDYSPENLSLNLGIAESMAREVMFENDDDFRMIARRNETPEDRWSRMREWVRSNIRRER